MSAKASGKELMTQPLLFGDRENICPECGGGLHLCGYPFKASADASWQHARNEYLYTYNRPDVVGAGWTKNAASALNSDVYTKVHV
jgi:hypothetical protein